MKSSHINMDKSKPRTVVYHQTDASEGMMVYSGEVEGFYKKGYVDSPAKFGANQVAIEVNQVAIEVKDQFSEMSASELAKHINEKDTEAIVTYRTGKDKLLVMARELEGGEDDNSSEDN